MDYLFIAASVLGLSTWHQQRMAAHLAIQRLVFCKERVLYSLSCFVHVDQIVTYIHLNHVRAPLKIQIFKQDEARTKNIDAAYN